MTQTLQNTTSLTPITNQVDCSKLIMGYEMEVGSRRSGPSISVDSIRRALIDANINWVYVTHDYGTVDAEIVFLPLILDEASIEEYVKPVQDVVERAGGYIRIRCGGHIHVGCRTPKNITSHEFNAKQVQHWKNVVYSDLSGIRGGNYIAPNIELSDLMPFELIKDVVYSYAKNQDYINSTLPESRRLDNDDSWHRPIHRILDNENFHSARNIGSWSDRILGKRNAINVSTYGSKGTIEFRQGASTLSSQKLLNWVKTIKHIYNNSSNNCNWTTYVIPETTRTIETTTPTQHNNGRSFVARVYDMCRNHNNGQGATIEEIMNVTNAGDQNIRSRISELRRTYGQGAIVTHTQQSNDHVYGDGQIYCRYQILHSFNKTVTNPSNEMPNVDLIDDPNYDILSTMSDELRTWNEYLIRTRS